MVPARGLSGLHASALDTPAVLSDGAAMTVLEGTHWWILRDGEPIKVSFREYCDWNLRPFEETHRIVETFVDTPMGSARVSTVFLSIDHNWGGGPPVLFETMVFGGPEEWDEYQERYSTLAAAKAGHDRIVTEMVPR